MKNNIMVFERGDIFTYDFGTQEGSIQSGKRPVLILQSDSFNPYSPTTIVAAITSVQKKTEKDFHIILDKKCGLKKTSVLLLEQIQSVNKAGLQDYIGRIDDEGTWIQINNVLKKTFGLWVHNANRIGEIICLCHECLNKSFEDKGLVFRRIDPLKKDKAPCEKCGFPGYDYMLYDKKRILGTKKQTGRKIL